VQHPDRHDLAPEEVEGPLDLVQLQVGLAAVERVLVDEGVGVPLPEDGRGAGVGVDGQVAPHQLVEPAEVVEAAGVVGVGVGHQHRVDPVEPDRQRLETKLGRGVDQVDALAVADDGRGAGAPIARVRRAADAAVAADEGDAVRGTGAEERQGRHVRASIAATRGTTRCRRRPHPRPLSRRGGSPPGSGRG